MGSVRVGGAGKAGGKEKGKRAAERRTRGNGMVEMGEGQRMNKERDMIEEATMRLGRNLTLEKFPGIHKDDPS